MIKCISTFDAQVQKAFYAEFARNLDLVDIIKSKNIEFPPEILALKEKSLLKEVLLEYDIPDREKLKRFWITD